MNSVIKTSAALVVLAGVVALGLPAAQGAFIPVYGGPTYDSAAVTGFVAESVAGVNNFGVAVGNGDLFASGTCTGPRAMRWDSSGAAPTELGNLGASSKGSAIVHVSDLNDSGIAVGGASWYDSGTDKGEHAVRWALAGAAATELGNLGTDSTGSTVATACAVSSGGTCVGYARFYYGVTDQGARAVRWDASGTAATELGHLGTDGIGYTWASASAVNGDGTAVGYARFYLSGTDRGTRPVRWAASGTTATQLGDLGTDNDGNTEAAAVAINPAGTAVGGAFKYDGGNCKGYRAVRWVASGTAATELGTLGTDGNGYTWASASADAGPAVGGAFKYVGGSAKGLRAVRWDASGTAATELGNLGTDSNDKTASFAYDANNAGLAVGYATKYVNGSCIGDRAVVWGADGEAFDLNALVDPASGWTLTEAKAISSDGQWIAGMGTYDPDGAGPLAGYSRLWTIYVPQAAIAVVSPNGGEVWTIGSTATATWSSAGCVGNADMDLSTDGGVTWAPLVGQTTNDGAEGTVVPDKYSKTCRLRLRQHSGGSPSDMSDADFTITIRGDGTLDGTVDSDDFSVMVTYWNTFVTACTLGDYNGDGYVDGSDFSILLTNWHRHATPGGEAGSPSVVVANVPAASPTGPAKENALATAKTAVTAEGQVATGHSQSAIEVNFQPAGVATPPACLCDSGSAYTARDNGYSYGWLKDVSAYAVQKNSSLSPDVRYDTSIMLIKDATWEMAIPNGLYNVKVVAGGDAGTIKSQRFSVEGVPMTCTTAGLYFEQTMTIVVSDGKLTINGQAGSTICFVQITHNE